MSKLIKKRNKKIFFLSCLLFSFLLLQIGCVHKKTKNNSVSPKIITKVQETDRKKPVSELIDWKHEKILGNTLGIGDAMALNSKYLFYFRSDYKLIRVNRKNKEKMILMNLKKQELSEEVSIALTKNKIYYTYDNALYQCDFEGGKKREILNNADVLKKNPEIIPEFISGVRIYKNKIYIQFGALAVGRIYPKTKKIKLIAEDVRSNWNVIGDYFYYLQRDNYGINQVNLKNFETKYIRGTEWPDNKKKEKSSPRYRDLMVVKNSLYYTCSIGEKNDILYRYRGDKNDKKISVSKGMELFSFNSGYGWIGFNKKGIRKWICFFNVKTKQITKIKIPKNFFSIGQVVDDIFIYEIEEPAKNKSEADYDYSYRMIKINMQE